MIIDEINVMLSHSEHSPILLEVETGKEGTTRTMCSEEKQGVQLSPSKRTAEKFREELDKILTATDLDGLGTQQKCSALQKALIEATAMSCQGGQVKKGKRSFAPKWLRRLHTKSRCIESRLRQLNQEKLLTGFNPDASGRAKVQRLQHLTDQAKRARVAYSEAALNLYQGRPGMRNWLILNCLLNNSGSWSGRWIESQGACRQSKTQMATCTQISRK